LTSSYSPPERKRRRGTRVFQPPELSAAGITPDKSLGQHFLTDRRVTDQIVAAALLRGTETVVEVGAGLGVLTEALAAAAGRVLAIEIDADLCAYLRRRFEGVANVRVEQRDIFAVDPAALLGPAESDYGVVGNLPYNAGTAIIRHLLEAAHPPRWLVVMLQREVAEAIAAPPGDLSLVGVAVQVYAEARCLFHVPPAAFYPPPKVRSTVLRLDVRPRPLVPAEECERFFGVVRAGFSAPRKQLRNSLALGLKVASAEALALLARAGIDPTLRPAALAVEDWLRLSRAVVS